MVVPDGSRGVRLPRVVRELEGKVRHILAALLGRGGSAPSNFWSDSFKLLSLLVVPLYYVGLPVLAAAPVPDQQHNIWCQTKEYECDPGKEPHGVPQVLCFLLVDLLVVQLDVGGQSDFRDVADEAGELAHQLLILPLRGLEERGRQFMIEIVKVDCFLHLVEHFVHRAGCVVQQRLEVRTLIAFWWQAEAQRDAHRHLGHVQHGLHVGATGVLVTCICIPEVRVEVQRIEIETGDVWLQEVHKHMPYSDLTVVRSAQVERFELRESLEELGQVAGVPARRRDPRLSCGKLRPAVRN